MPPLVAPLQLPPSTETITNKKLKISSAFAFAMGRQIISSSAWRDAPDGVANLKVRKSACDALNKGLEHVEKWSKLLPRQGRPLKNSMIIPLMFLRICFRIDHSYFSSYVFFLHVLLRLPFFVLLLLICLFIFISDCSSYFSSSFLLLHHFHYSSYCSSFLSIFIFKFPIGIMFFALIHRGLLDIILLSLSLKKGDAGWKEKPAAP